MTRIIAMHCISNHRFHVLSYQLLCHLVASSKTTAGMLKNAVKSIRGIYRKEAFGANHRVLRLLSDVAIERCVGTQLVADSRLFGIVSVFVWTVVIAGANILRCLRIANLSYFLWFGRITTKIIVQIAVTTVTLATR